MKIATGISAAFALLCGICNAEESPPARASNAEGIAVVKSVGNLFRGTQNDPTPWECEPTLLYAAKYPLAQRDLDYVLDFCSLLSLSKRGAVGSNIFDVTENIARERPKTEQKLQRYKQAPQFFLEVTGLRVAYQGTPGAYKLSWHVPRLDLLHQASGALMTEYMNELRAARDPNFNSVGYSTTALAEDYKRSGLEFFDRKFGKGASVALGMPAPWTTLDHISLKAPDDKTAYALEGLTSNPPQREIDGTTFFLLERTGNLFFNAEADGDKVRVTPVFIEAWLYKKVVRIPLAGDTYTIACRNLRPVWQEFQMRIAASVPGMS